MALGWLLRRGGVNHKRYSWAFGIAVLGYVFRGDILIYLGLVAAYYAIIRAGAGRWGFVWGLWAVVVANLFAMEYFKNSRAVSDLLERHLFGDGFMANSNHVLHWSSLFNMTLLRIVSFGLDWHRKLTNTEEQTHFQKCRECSRHHLCIKGAEVASARVFSYGRLVNYLLYPPTMLTGPPMCYNNFMAACEPDHARSQCPTVTRSKPSQEDVGKYCLRVGLDLLAFELYQRFVMAGGLIREPRLWADFGLAKTELLSLFSVGFIWLKFLVIWRVGRMFALLDGYEVYENMNRCMFNNYSVEGFWRGWHRGFNQWLVRYLFIPMGGSSRKLLSIWPIFGFVALWHDVNPRLLAWAWLCCLAMVPEVVARALFADSPLHQARWFSYLSALGGSLIVKGLVLLNLIGFGLGAGDGEMLLKKVSWQGLGEWVLTLVMVSFVVHLMYYIRQKEGKNKNF